MLPSMSNGIDLVTFLDMIKIRQDEWELRKIFNNAK